MFARNVTRAKAHSVPLAHVFAGGVEAHGPLIAEGVPEPITRNPDRARLTAVAVHSPPLSGVGWPNSLSRFARLVFAGAAVAQSTVAPAPATAANAALDQGRIAEWTFCSRLRPCCSA